jgi:hypothetical protein
VLARTVDRLLGVGLPILAGHQAERESDGTWWAAFSRGAASARIPDARARTAGRTHYQAERIVAAVGENAGRRWWTRCVERLVGGPRRGPSARRLHHETRRYLGVVPACRRCRQQIGS